MKSIFEALNISLVDSEFDGQCLELLVVKNSDGSPRWITPKSSSKPLFLKFYHQGTFRSQLIYRLIKLVYVFRIQSFVFKRHTLYVDAANLNRNQIIDPSSHNWALFAGTPGPNNKLVVYSEASGVGSFTKIATTPKAVDLIKNEDEALWKLAFYAPQEFQIPKVLSVQGKSLQLADISGNASRRDRFGQPHFRALTELYSKTSERVQFDELLQSLELEEKLYELGNSNNPKIPKAILRKLELLVGSIKGSETEVAMGHGDFTPWNMCVKDEMLCIYDWELSHSQLPIGFDAFHFIIQKGILIDKKCWKQTRKELLASISEDDFATWLSPNTGTMDQYLKMYLAINVINCLHLYSKQPVWHEQIHWLLTTWNDALSDLMKEQKSSRELLIMDLFDFLHSKKYVAIKFPNHLPERLSEYSDIDLCIERKDLNVITKMLQSSSVVKEFNLEHKTFMRNLHIICVDDTFLNIDLIWKIKRKGLVMMDAKKVLSEVHVTQYGIKLMSLIHKVRYIGLFYGLNNQSIPSKFKPLEQLLNKSVSKLDRLLYSNYTDSGTRGSELKICVNLLSQNKGLARIGNHLDYVFDSLKQLFNSGGMIISFSGVDGAGKSTIIENTKKQLEKKFRKRVVVLRHRPSFLPIISAWTKGKKRAEMDSINSLPRQGNNTGSMSSVLRFMYYYTDYVFGQFIINLVYKQRGFIVLYDRYYFDFIVDGKRSNIQLPQNILQRAYKLLLQPDFNFFLYADPNLILERKQELSKEVIIELTNSYLSLFMGLGSQHRNTAKYISIENVNVDSTVAQIISATQQRTAS
jgi:thymidylate kinase